LKYASTKDSRITCIPELKFQQFNVGVAAQLLVIQSGTFDMIAIAVEGVEMGGNVTDTAAENKAFYEVFHDPCSCGCYVAT
jgi:hypothetical protein